MSAHTKGPWSIGSSLGMPFLKGPDGREISYSNNAARIVTCVNACEGIGNPAEHIAKLEARIEGLRKSLNNVVGDFYWFEEHGGKESTMGFIRDTGTSIRAALEADDLEAK